MVVAVAFEGYADAAVIATFSHLPRSTVSSADDA